MVGGLVVWRHVLPTEFNNAPKPFAPHTLPDKLHAETHHFERQDLNIRLDETEYTIDCDLNEP